MLRTLMTLGHCGVVVGEHRPYDLLVRALTTGNGDIGRYFLLPGSNGRAMKMSENMTDVYIRKSSRGHDVYCGKYQGVDVCLIFSTLV